MCRLATRSYPRNGSLFNIFHNLLKSFMLKEVIHFLAIVGGDPSVATNAPQGDINPRHVKRSDVRIAFVMLNAMKNPLAGESVMLK
jgi:hypothetical protein